MLPQADSTKQVLKGKDTAPPKGKEAKGKQAAPAFASYDEWTEGQKQLPFWKRCATLRHYSPSSAVFFGRLFQAKLMGFGIVLLRAHCIPG